MASHILFKSKYNIFRHDMIQINEERDPYHDYIFQWENKQMVQTRGLWNQFIARIKKVASTKTYDWDTVLETNINQLGG